MTSNLHWNQKAAARVGDDWVEIKRDVRLGNVPSPDLFSMYSQVAMDELEGLEGIQIGGRNVNNIRSADDKGIDSRLRGEAISFSEQAE